MLYLWMDPESAKGGLVCRYDVWFAENDDNRNESSPVPMGERQSIPRAELRGTLGRRKKRLGIRLHIPADSELVYLGFKGRCGKWNRHKWEGFREPLAHKDLWIELWDQWLLLGESVSVQWAPLHMGVDNEQANRHAAKGQNALCSRSRFIKKSWAFGQSWSWRRCWMH